MIYYGLSFGGPGGFFPSFFVIIPLVVLTLTGCRPPDFIRKGGAAGFAVGPPVGKSGGLDAAAGGGAGGVRAGGGGAAGAAGGVAATGEGGGGGGAGSAGA